MYAQNSSTTQLKNLFALLSGKPLISFCGCGMQLERLMVTRAQGSRATTERPWDLYYCHKCGQSTMLPCDFFSIVERWCSDCRRFSLACKSEIIREPNHIRHGKVEITICCRKCSKETKEIGYLPLLKLKNAGDWHHRQLGVV